MEPTVTRAELEILARVGQRLFEPAIVELFQHAPHAQRLAVVHRRQNLNRVVNGVTTREFIQHDVVHRRAKAHN